MRTRCEAGGLDDFGGFVRRIRARGDVVVQPRMGFSDPAAMRSALHRMAAQPVATAGTITVDSYTRLGDYAAARSAVAAGAALNGYPIVTAGAGITRALVDGLRGPTFQVQVRHGSSNPLDIFRAMSAAGIHATEGGPLSYCLPYGRTPVAESVDNWRRACELLASWRGPDVEPHLETFGGCMMGQLCPPELLVAVSVLEALFFRQHGVRSISLSYTQQTHHQQDREALAALRAIARRYLGDIDWHIVLYSYMGVFPSSVAGARRLNDQAATLAVDGGVDRLVVKTAAEAHRIPSIAENITALLDAASRMAAAAVAGPSPLDSAVESTVLPGAQALIEAVLQLSDDVGRALVLALRRGVLDVPFCVHPDNAGRAASHIDRTGRLAWSRVGAMPLRAPAAGGVEATSAGLLADLTYVARRYDAVEAPTTTHSGVTS